MKVVQKVVLIIVHRGVCRVEVGLKKVGRRRREKCELKRDKSAKGQARKFECCGDREVQDPGCYAVAMTTTPVHMI